MAKREMMCPFSERLCRNCAVYVGRHYYRCFFKSYRGYIYHSEDDSSNENYLENKHYSDRDFEMPAVTTEVLDPFTVTL